MSTTNTEKQPAPPKPRPRLDLLRRLGNFRVSKHFRDLAAVSIDGRTLEIVIARQLKGSTRIDRMDRLSLSEGLDVGDPMATGQFVGEALRGMKFKGAMLMSVPRGQAILKPLTLPPGTPTEQMPSMVQFQVEKELPFRLEEAVIDFTVDDHVDTTGETPGADGVNVLVAAVRLPVVDYYRKLAEAAQYPLLRLGLRPYANLCCLRACQSGGGPRSVALVHVRSEEAEIDVVSGQSLVFSRSVSASVPEGADSATEQARSQVVTSLVGEVLRSIQSLLAVQRNIKIDGVVVAGGTGIEEALAQQLSSRMSVPAEMLDPCGRLQLARPVERAGAFMSSLGLVLGHGSDRTLPFDFLNPKRPPVQRDARKTRVQAIAVAAIFGVLILGVARHMLLASVDNENRLLQAKLTELKEENKKVVSLGKTARMIDDWVSAQPMWLDHVAQVSACLPPADEAYIESMQVSGKNAIVFTIHASSDDSLSAMRQRLVEAGYQVRTDQVQRDNDRFGYIYRGNVEVTVAPQHTVEVASLEAKPRPGDDRQDALPANLRQTAAPRTSRSGGETRGPQPGSSGQPRPPQTVSAPPVGQQASGPQQTPAVAPVSGENASWQRIREAPSAFHGQSVQLGVMAGLAFARDAYVVAEAPREQYAAYEVRSREGPRMVVYVKKDSEAHRGFQNRRGGRGGFGGTMTVSGKLFHVPELPKQVRDVLPMAMIVEEVRQ